MAGSKERVVVLQDRDRKLFSELAVMRVIDRELAQRVAGFGSISRANARLLALTKAGYLKRSFTGTIAGGRKSIYRLSTSGLALAGVHSDGQAKQFGKSSWSEPFLEHQLRINQVYVWVKHERIPIVGWRFHKWLSFPGPLSKRAALIPDGYFEITKDGEIKASFVEIDMGTESSGIWQKKIEGYLHLAVSGEFKRLFASVSFKVLVIANSERRTKNIRRVASKLTDKIFRFASFEIIKRQGIWSAIWQKPVGDEKESLL